MGRPANRLHVRTYLENVVKMCEAITSSKDVVLPPAYRQYVVEIKIYGKAILRKHSGKRTRKDVYVETNGA